MKEIIVNVDNYNENSIKTIEGDNLNEVYKIYICKNKRRIDLTNKIAIMAYVNEYGSKKSNILALNITNAAESEIELPITNAISSENGVYACQIAILGENNYLEQTAPFNLIVEDSMFSKISNSVINSSDFQILSEAIKTTSEYAEKLKEGTENIELQYASKLNEIANKGTTIEVLEKVMKEELNKKIEDGTIANLTIEDDSITPNKTAFFNEENLNLIDDSKLFNGWLNGAEPNGDVGYKTTDFIPVKPNTVYVHSGAGAKCRQYTKDKEDNGVYESGTETKENTYFVRMSTNNGNVQNWRMNRGSKLNEYVPYGTVKFNIENKNLEKEIKNLCKTEINNIDIVDQIGNGEIPFEKTDILVNVNENLIDTTKLSMGYMRDGVPNGDDRYRTTDFIPVKNGASYVIITSALNLEKWGYDQDKLNKTPLQISDGIFKNDEESNIRYVRFTLKKENVENKDASMYESKINLGVYPLDVKEYKVRNVETPEVEEKESGLNVINCNLYNKETCLTNGYYLNPNKIDSLPNVSGSDFIKIDSNKRYIIYTAGGNGVKTYNKYKYITPTPMFTEDKGVYTFKEGVHYITVNSGQNIINKTYVSEFSYNKPEVKPHDYKTLDITDGYFDDFYNIIKYGHLRGGVYGSIGDSISAPGKYQQVVCDKLQLINNSNGAVSSARYCDTDESNRNLAYYNMDKLPEKCDIVTIMLGTNDISNNSPIGEFFDNTLKTFYGALHVTFKKMIEKYPNARLGVITPPQRNFKKNKEMLEKHLKYSKIIKEVAEYYSLPVLWGHGAGVRSGLNDEYNHFVDGLHPNETGYKAYGERVCEFVANLPIYK